MNTDIRKQESIFKLAGFDGCIVLSDGTHIPTLKCSQWASNLHKGFKLNLQTRTYNITVDHLRKIRGSTTRHPGTWNNKPLILFDEFICSVHNGKFKPLSPFSFYHS